MRRPTDFARHPVGFLAAQQSGQYRAVCLYVVDGDTFDVLLDQGFYVYSYHTIRLRRLDAPELFSGTPEERAQGQIAKDTLGGLILTRPLLIRTYRDTQTFGRFVADATRVSPDTLPVDVAEMMAAMGHGTLT